MCYVSSSKIGLQCWAMMRPQHGGLQWQLRLSLGVAIASEVPDNIPYLRRLRR